MLGQVPALAIAATVLGATASGSDRDRPSPLEPSNLWTMGIMVSVLFTGLMTFLGAGERSRTDPIWRVLPGIDLVYAQRFAKMAGVSPRPWLIAGRVGWILVVLIFMTLSFAILATVLA